MNQVVLIFHEKCRYLRKLEVGLMDRIVIAIGGNMISDASKKGELFEDQVKKAENTAKLLVEIVKKGYNVIITHGNGPQVGSLLLQQESNTKNTTKLPLDILTSLTQGQIGVMLQHALVNELKNQKINKHCVIIPTTVIVDKNDPAFQNPTKPIGPFYPEEEYTRIDKKENEHYVKTPKGYRKVVPSPYPVSIFEKDVIDDLSLSQIVICVGGGGTPTISNNENLKRVDAVIDKDLASSRLALELRAQLLVILTNVEGVFEGYNTDNPTLHHQLTVKQAEKLLNKNEFGKGSMAPKVKAAIEFSKVGETIITSPDKILEALDKKAGTRITSIEY